MFISSLFIIRVPFFSLLGFSKGFPKIKRAKGYHSGTSLPAPASKSSCAMPRLLGVEGLGFRV